MRLALDTAFSACSVALSDLDGNLAGHAHLDQRRGQVETLVPMVEEVLKKAGIKPQNITEIVVNIGPGTFAGVRIATSFTRALALSTGAKTVGLTAFEALAGTFILKKKAKPGDKILSLVPGKRGEVSGELFLVEECALKSLKGPETISIKALNDFTQCQKVFVAGPDLENFLKEATGLSPLETLSFWPSATDLLDLAANLGPERRSVTVSPFYLRPPDAKTQDPSPFSRENG